uniref:UTP-monosaccharide-1-phosphate uridylyltransferase n=1 Tax=Aureoumbra lagunensis TaxID=44058 RepID=A0A7S3JVS8_9STRA|mmetsp:Transcript_1511/g.1931  ORF Transcript_1511/g.1931 Transcript_1511/m.1931 type:complete len:609 (+) Transcript_1511:23-1849(+)
MEWITEPEEKRLVEVLNECGQSHLFEDWTAEDSVEDRKNFFAQIEKLNSSYPGGLKAYVESAKSLLAASARGDNPLDGWVPSVPTGESLEFGSEAWAEHEMVGVIEAKKCGFVLVAGGLGERLGYSRIKIELPIETLTKISYLEYYIKYILALQQKSKTNLKLPLAIMVSDDTEAMTKEMLIANKYFGAAKNQITLLKQEKVAALADNEGRIAADGKYAVQSKPHGHGDVHVLLHQSGTLENWVKRGIQWVYFFQDTNALGFRPLLATLGLSKKLNLHCNFLTVPRLPGQAVGGIAKLHNQDENKTMVVNVEYNQLDPLLRATVNPQGDVAGPDSIYSPYPGNINQFLLQAQPYLATLKKTQGIMSEFVNPKYADETKTKFKKPARLECMMQDYPKVLAPEEKVGFIEVPSWIAYSPCKNNTNDAVTKSPPACALSAEADQYYHCTQMLRVLGCDIATSEKSETWCGISTNLLSPAIVLTPSVGVGLIGIKASFPTPSFVKISTTSSLVLNGEITVRSLILDGALIINAVPGAKVIVLECVIKNKGYHRIPCAEDAPESLKIRGYDTVPVEDDSVQLIDITSSGTWTVMTDFATKKIVVKKKDVCPIS